jgi:hypothetical protein
VLACTKPNGTGDDESAGRHIHRAGAARIVDAGRSRPAPKEAWNVGRIARALAVAAMVTIAVAGCGSAVESPAAPSGPQSAAPAHPCSSGERYVVGRVYPLGACLPDTPSEQASCAPGEHAVVGRVNPLGECYPDARPTPIRSCPPGERLVVGRVNSYGDCLPAFSP